MIMQFERRKQLSIVTSTRLIKNSKLEISKLVKTKKIEKSFFRSF